MPGTWSGHERLRHMKYQTVMIESLLCHRPCLVPLSRFCSGLPIFVVRCTGPDILPLSLLHGGGRSGSFLTCMRETICENNYLV